MRHMTTLTYIDTVARLGSIRSAAEVLSITASALNRRILAIEEELGVDLFERHAQGVTLNSAGELFIHHIRNQIADLERVRSRIADLQGNRRGHIRIGAEHAVLPKFLPRQIAAYSKMFPQVTFELHSGTAHDIETALMNQDLDIIFVLDSRRVAEFDALIYHPQVLHALVPKDHPLADQDQVSMADCVQHPVIVPPRQTALREKIESSLSRTGLVLQVIVETDDPRSTIDMARAGIGIGFGVGMSLPSNIGLDLHIAPVVLRNQSSPLLVVGQRRGRSLPVAVGKFVEEIRSALARDIG